MITYIFIIHTYVRSGGGDANALADASVKTIFLYLYLLPKFKLYSNHVLRLIFEVMTLRFVHALGMVAIINITLYYK